MKQKQSSAKISEIRAKYQVEEEKIRNKIDSLDEENSSKEYKHICKLPGGSYFVGGPKINGDPGSKAFKTLEEALEYRNNRYKEKYPNSYEMYIKE